MIDLQKHINTIAHQIHHTASHHLRENVQGEMREVRSYGFYADSTTYRRSGATVIGANRNVVDTEALLHSITVTPDLSIESELPYAQVRLHTATALTTHAVDAFKFSIPRYRSDWKKNKRRQN